MKHTTLSQPQNDVLPTQPLAITIPEPTRDNVAFRALIRQVIPMLQCPEAHSPAARHQLASTLIQALGLPQSDTTEPQQEAMPPHTDAEAPCAYEPGCDSAEWP